MEHLRSGQRRLRLTRQEQATLQRLLRTGRSGLWIAARARAVLLAAQGASLAAIARAAGRDRKWVRHWLARLARDRLGGRHDSARSGRPPKFSPRGTA